jgi:hypothetical protein
MNLSKWLSGLKSSYPDPNQWKKHEEIKKIDAYRFARLWLFEGIPYAFKENPGIYELAREAIAHALDEHPNNIRMNGSARLGYSLASTKFGKRYDPKQSDIDLFMISQKWFDKLKADAEEFISRYESGEAVPSNDREKTYWKGNCELLPKNIAKGFINQIHIPNYDRYQSARACYKACDQFLRIIKKNSRKEVLIKKITIRVYKDLKSAENQIGGSLLFCMKQTGFTVS